MVVCRVHDGFKNPTSFKLAPNFFRRKGIVSWSPPYALKTTTIYQPPEDLSLTVDQTPPHRSLGFDRCRRLRDAVTHEERVAYQSLVKMYQKSNLKTLIQQGVLLTNLSAQLSGSLYRMFIIKLQNSNSRYLPRHRFSTGDATSLSLVNEDWTGNLTFSDIDKRKWDVVVHSVASTEITILLDLTQMERFQTTNSKNAKWRLDSRFQNTTCQRQFSALDKLTEFELEINPVRALQAKLLDIPIPEDMEHRMFPTWQYSKKLSNSVLQMVNDNENINQSQKEAIQAATKQRITLWQGPPGSGKTHTLLAFLECVCRASREFPKLSPWPILVCAETNTAVDNLVYGLLKRKVRVVRIGQPSKTRDILLPSTLEARAENTKEGVLYKESNEQVDKLKQLLKATKDPSLKKETSHHIKEYTNLAERYYQNACNHVLDSCEVVACTCSSAGVSSLARRIFKMVVVDEATQSTEPCTLVPIMMGAESLIMAGDPEQLPPTILSNEALKAGLGYSLFSRLAINGTSHLFCVSTVIFASGSHPVLLDIQYRMHPQICAFPSKLFYNGKLKTAERCQRSRQPKWFAASYQDARVVFVNSESLEHRSSRAQIEASLSYRNQGEAYLAIDILKELVSYRDVKTVALLTPYKGQEVLLEQLVRKYKRHLYSTEIFISTVDGFQGREAEVVIFSAVRSNIKRNLGFVTDSRRMNVAITRAKRGLIVIGNRDTLSANHLWESWIESHEMQTEEHSIDVSNVHI